MKQFCDLKFTDNLDVDQIKLLTQRLGFRFFSKNFGNWTLYRKYYGPNGCASDKIGEATRNVLARECDRICEPFYRPNGVMKADVIKALTSFANMKPNVSHKNWVLNWMKENVENVEEEEEEDIVPWMDRY